MPILPGVVAIVDDDASVLRALERALRVYQYRVEVFASAEQYLGEVDAGEISCAVIDVNLGGELSGLDLGKAITAGHATPIVFMSGGDDPVAREHARAVGCIDFLEKPFFISNLIAALRTLEDRAS